MAVYEMSQNLKKIFITQGVILSTIYTHAKYIKLTISNILPPPSPKKVNQCTVLFLAIRCSLHAWFLVAGERRNRARKLDGEVRLYPVLYWLCSWSRKRLEISVPVLQKWRRSGHTFSELAYSN